jgi:WD repeat-containing protein 23
MLWREAYGPRVVRRVSLAYAAADGAHFYPNLLAGAVSGFESALFNASFSRDGQMLFTACQDGTINLYGMEQLLYVQARCKVLETEGGRTTAEPFQVSASCPTPQAPDQLLPQKQIHCQYVGWAIVGSCFSPDAKWIAYSSWSRSLHLTNTFGRHELHEAIVVSPHRSHHFCLFSLAFSADGAKVIGGGNDGGLHLIHLERKHASHIEQAHQDDVNSVCFVDPEQAPSLVLSGSDDGLIKLWDLRTERAQGLLAGHVSGITSVCSKDGGPGGGRGGGRYLVSNGKDQTTKLWDLRKMVEAGRDAEARYAVDLDGDYRFATIWNEGGGRGGGRQRRRKHPVGDHSIQTWRGHRIARTLIQPAFSSEALTGGRYVVTGSADGRLFAYDTLAAEGEGAEQAGREDGRAVEKLAFHDDVVRTVAFAPQVDLMVSAGWDGNLGLWRFRGQQAKEEEGEGS